MHLEVVQHARPRLLHLFETINLIGDRVVEHSEARSVYKAKLEQEEVARRQNTEESRMPHLCRKTYQMRPGETVLPKVRPRQARMSRY